MLKRMINQLNGLEKNTRLWLLGVFIAPLMLVLCASHASAYGVFNTQARQSSDMSAFHKWHKVRNKHESHMGRMRAACEKGRGCALERWEAMLDAAKDKPWREQLVTVNRYMNASPYVKDIVNWGVTDYWETLHEFTSRRGDCEDYAIAKYESLKRLGFNSKDLTIVVLNDMNLRTLHAVLAVNKGGHTYILDNQIKEVLKDSAIHHYKPIYSINEYAWWRHLPKN